MTDFETIIRTTQDLSLTSRYSGAIYVLENILRYIDNNKDIAVNSKVIIKRYIESEIERYTELNNRTETVKTLNSIPKKTQYNIS